MRNLSLDASYHVSVSIGFTLYLVWYLFTSIPTLIANISIHRMVSVYPLASFFSIRHFISPPLIINSSQTGFRFFKTSTTKTAKTLYTFFCASFAPGPLLNLSPLPLHLHTYRINHTPPTSYGSVLFCFTPPLVHYYPLYLLPCSSLMSTHFLCSYAILCHIVLAVDTIHMLLSLNL